MEHEASRNRVIAGEAARCHHPTSSCPSRLLVVAHSTTPTKRQCPPTQKASRRSPARVESFVSLRDPFFIFPPPPRRRLVFLVAATYPLFGSAGPSCLCRARAVSTCGGCEEREWKACTKRKGRIPGSPWDWPRGYWACFFRLGGDRSKRRTREQEEGDRMQAGKKRGERRLNTHSLSLSSVLIDHAHDHPQARSRRQKDRKLAAAASDPRLRQKVLFCDTRSRPETSESRHVASSSFFLILLLRVYGPCVSMFVCSRCVAALGTKGGRQQAREWRTHREQQQKMAQEFGWERKPRFLFACFWSWTRHVCLRRPDLAPCRAPLLGHLRTGQNPQHQNKSAHSAPESTMKYRRHSSYSRGETKNSPFPHTHQAAVVQDRS